MYTAVSRDCVSFETHNYLKTTRNFECILWLKRLKVLQSFTNVMYKRCMSERAKPQGMNLHFVRSISLGIERNICLNQTLLPIAV